MSGVEWIIECYGCNPSCLRDLERLRVFFERVVEGMSLNPVEPTVWYQFPGTGGITGLCLLAESHLACHTFPEFASLCVNVFCCRPRPDWDFEACLKAEFGAASVRVRRIEREYGDARRECAA